MKKKLFILLLIVLNLKGIICFANEPVPVQFKKHGGGQFIYCNNTEFVKENDLSTIENPNAKYMMNNENLQPGNYSVFFCFYNWTDFDVEPDIEFKTSSNAEITINSIGYYLPQENEEWDCLGAWADYLNIDIRPLSNKKQYIHYQGKTPLPAKISLNNNNDWISRYIYNYDVLKPRITFNMLVDFTIESGEADVNFAALKHYDVTGDRSYHNPNAAFGKYVRDTAIKGIETQTLPIVEADIDIDITEDTPNGEDLDVRVFNQSNPNGVTVPYWTSNINPNSDGSIFCRNTAVSSDMLDFTYKDNSKLDYYGKNVPEEEKDNIWHMDIYHQDTQWYSSSMPWSADDHIPNKFTGEYRDINETIQTELEFNLGNFGVINRHNFTVTNSDTVMRTLNYFINSSRTSNIVIVRDEEGNILNPYTLEKENAYAISKNISWSERQEVCMFSAPIPAGETKKYTLDVILPTNNYGGQLNILRVDNKKLLNGTIGTPFPIYDDYSKENTFFNGSEYMKWKDGNLYSADNTGLNWKKINLPEETKQLFKDNSWQMKIIKTDDGYAARYCAWDNFYAWLSNMKDKNKLYIFDKDFNLADVQEFADYIYDFVYTNGKIYLKSDAIYCTNVKEEAQKTNESKLPQNNGTYSLIKRNDGIYTLYNGTDLKLSFECDTPWEMSATNGLFYYRKSWKDDVISTEKSNILSISRDGVNWNDIKLPDTFLELLEVYCSDNKIYINTKHENFVYNMPTESNVRVRLNNELLSFETHAEITNERTMVPLRFFFEKLGADVQWNEVKREVTVKKNKKSIVLTIDSQKAFVDGDEKTIDVSPYIKNDRTMIPLRFLSENLGFLVDWDINTHTASVVSDF